MAKNCSADVSLVVDHVDSVLSHGTAAEIQALKEMFGLQDLEHNDDFARYLFSARCSCTRLTLGNSALQNGPWLWQENSFTTGYSAFFQFCDFVEASARRFL